MEERNKKLLIWAGFKLEVKLDEGPNMSIPIWIYPDGEWDLESDIPNFTDPVWGIAHCFKWLVPPALEILAKEGYIPPIMKLFQLWYDELVSLTGDSSNVEQAAKALCYAIEKLID